MTWLGAAHGPGAGGGDRRHVMRLPKHSKPEIQEGPYRLLQRGPDASNLRHGPFEFAVHLTRDHALPSDRSHRHPQLTEPLAAGGERGALNLSQLAGGAV
jgi:hypothetical protein